MKRKFTLFGAVLLAVLFTNFCRAQSCTDCRYIAPVFDSVVVTTGVYFAHGMNADGVDQDLFMDIYEPYGDTMAQRPLIVFAFGGGFVQGSRTDWYVIELSRMFAQAGYVCAAMDYRYGIVFPDAISYQRIFFRPMQDMRACVQYFKADYSETGNTYKIDTNLIILSGASAGAITALMTAYCDKESEFAQLGNVSSIAALGGFYSTSGAHPNYGWNALATINLAGALLDADWIEPGDVPVISGHGDLDATVPYRDGGLGGLTFLPFGLEGSFLVDSVARAKGVCSYLYTMEGQDHPNEDMGIPYIRSVLGRMMIRMHAVINGRSFCCPLAADITPGDTLVYDANTPPTTLNAQITNAQGSPLLQWCPVSCQGTSNTSSIVVQPDTTLEYVTVLVSEGQCQSGDLHIVMDSSTYISLDAQNIGRDISFAVYPQPSSGVFTVQADLSEYAGKDLTLEVYNMMGVKVISKPVAATHFMKVIVDGTELPAGNYFVALKNGGAFAGAKMILIQR